MNRYSVRKTIFLLAAAAWIAGGFPGIARGEEEAVPQYNADGLRNPFKPYVVKEAAPTPEPEIVYKPLPSFHIDGVFWGGDFPQAILNGKIVKEGDVIEDAKVISISRERIRFIFANREFSISPESMANQQIRNP